LKLNVLLVNLYPLSCFFCRKCLLEALLYYEKNDSSWKFVALRLAKKLFRPII
jgi:hypothetical protein